MTSIPSEARNSAPMNRDEARHIIESEGLTRIVWFTDPTNEVDVSGISATDNGWITYITDERAAVSVVKNWHSESDALEDLIKRARTWQRIQQLRARRGADDDQRPQQH